MAKKNKGLEFEHLFAKSVLSKPNPGSGNKWYARMDIVDSLITWSCKFTSKKSFSLKQSDIDEVVGVATGPGSNDSIPALAIRIGTSDYDVVVLRKDDFLRIVQEETKYVQATKTEAKRKRTKIPRLLQEES